MASWTAQLSVSIFPLMDIEPEQSRSQKKWTGRWAIAPPGISDMGACLYRYAVVGGVDGMGHGHSQLIVQARTAMTVTAASARAASVTSRCRRM